MPRARRLPSRARAARLLLQLAPRRLPALHRARAQLEIDPDLLVPDTSISINEGALVPWTIGSQSFDSVIEAIAERYEISLDTPWRDLTGGAGPVPLRHGRRPDLRRLPQPDGSQAPVHDGVRGARHQPPAPLRETDSSQQRDRIEYMSFRPCPECGGARLKPEVLAVKIGGDSIHQFTRMSVTAALRFVDELELTKTEELIGRRILKEVRERLTFLDNVGVGCLQLDQAAKTLRHRWRGAAAPAGDADRIAARRRPLHPRRAVDRAPQRDNGRLIDTLEKLRDVGNTVLVVEHDEQMMRSRTGSSISVLVRGARRRDRRRRDSRRHRVDARLDPAGS